MLFLIGMAMVLCGEALEGTSTLFTYAEWILFVIGIDFAMILLFPDLKAIFWINLIGVVNSIVCCVVLMGFSISLAAPVSLSNIYREMRPKHKYKTYVWGTY